MLIPIGASAAGIRVGITELTAAAGNIANAQDEAPPALPGYRPLLALPIPVLGGGVAATLVPTSDPGVLVQQPTSPVADASGLVRMPDVDLAQQMTGQLVASSTVALNVAAMRRALKAYRAALDIDGGLRPVPDAGEADRLGG